MPAPKKRREAVAQETAGPGHGRSRRAPAAQALSRQRWNGPSSDIRGPERLAQPPVSCSEKRGAGLGALSARTGRTSPSTRGWNRAGGRGFRQDGLRAADKGSFLEEGPWDTGHSVRAHGPGREPPAAPIWLLQDTGLTQHSRISPLTIDVLTTPKTKTLQKKSKHKGNPNQGRHLATRRERMGTGEGSVSVCQEHWTEP